MIMIIIIINAVMMNICITFWLCCKCILPYSLSPFSAGCLGKLNVAFFRTKSLVLSLSPSLSPALNGLCHGICFDDFNCE